MMHQTEERGAAVLVVSFTPPQRVKAYVERYPQPFPVASDSRMKAYHAFALGKTRVGSFFRPGVMWHYIKLMFRGWLPGKPGKGEDLLQLGGDFILDGEQRLTWAYPSGESSDRPTAAEIVKRLEGI